MKRETKIALAIVLVIVLILFALFLYFKMTYLSHGEVKAEIAKLAIPRCNLVHLTGNDMYTALSGYLDALYSYDPQLVGGNLPDEAFYNV